MGRQFKPGQLQTGSLYDFSSSFAITASYALNSDGSGFPFSGSAVITGSLLVIEGGITGSMKITNLDSGSYTQSFTNQSTWTLQHNLNSAYVIVQVYDLNYEQVIPNFIDLQDANTAVISFAGIPFSGTAVAVVGSPLAGNNGGGNTAVSASYATSASSAITSISSSYAVTSSYASFAGNVVTINTSSFATTGSNSFKASQVITGSLTVTAGLYTGDSNIYIDADDAFPFVVGYGLNSPLVKTNTVIGYFSLSNNSTGGFNVSIGNATMQSNSTGHTNTAIGAGALGSNTVGFRNTAVGFQAAGSADTYNSVAIGHQSLINGGSNNTAVGYSAGKNASSSSQRNIYLGYDAGPSTSTTENDKLYISNASGTPLIAGDFAIKEVDINGTLVISGSLIVTGSTQGNVVALTISSNTASLDLSQASFYTLQLVAGTNTFINPSNIRPGVTSTLLISTTGSATVSFPTTVKQPSGSAYIPTTTTGKDVLTFISYDASALYVANVKNLI